MNSKKLFLLVLVVVGITAGLYFVTRSESPTDVATRTENAPKESSDSKEGLENEVALEPGISSAATPEPEAVELPPFGTLTVFRSSSEDLPDSILQFNNSPTEIKAPIINIERIFEFKHSSIALVYVHEGGNACAGMYRFFEAGKDGTNVTDEFGTCSDQPEVSVEDEIIFISFPVENGRKRYRYADKILEPAP